MVDLSSLQRVLETAGMRKTERVPVIPQVFGHAAIFNNVPLNDYLKDGRMLAECQVQAMESYGYDAVFAMMDVNVEAEALGAQVVYRDGLYPYIRYPHQGGAEGPCGFEVPDPGRDGRMPELLDAIRSLRTDLDGKKLVTSALLGPFTLVGQLLGAERALYLLTDDRSMFLDYLAFAKDVAIAYGTAQVRAGSHVPLMFDPLASPAVIPPHLFREIEAPMLAEVNRALKAAGALGTWLHIAGPSTEILPSFSEIGVTVANFDYEVSPADAMAALPSTCLDGNVRSLSFCLGSPKAVRADCDRLLREFQGRGGYILSSGCEIPLEARPDCIRAMVDAVKGE